MLFLYPCCIPHTPVSLVVELKEVGSSLFAPISIATFVRVIAKSLWLIPSMLQ